MSDHGNFFTKCSSSRGTKGTCPRQPLRLRTPARGRKRCCCGPRQRCVPVREKSVKSEREELGASEAAGFSGRQPAFVPSVSPAPKGLLLQGQEVLGLAHCWRCSGSASEDCEQKEGPFLFENTVAMALSLSNGIFLATCHFCFSLFAFKL